MKTVVLKAKDFKPTVEVIINGVKYKPAEE